MKKIILALTILCTFSTISFGQEINWSDYKEPDGTFKRFFIDPSLAFRFRDNASGKNSVFNLQLNSLYNINHLKERSIFRFTITPEFAISTDNDHTSQTESRTKIDLDPSIQYRQYFKERRGLFGEVNSLWSLNHQNQSQSGGEFRDVLQTDFFIGFGRLENVSTVYQSLRISDQIASESISNQDQIFSLADMMRSLDYNNVLDSRYQNIDKQTQYLNYISEMGVGLDDYYSIANALDAFNFERPNILSHGFEIKLGLGTNVSFSDDFSNYSGKLALNYGKAINKKMHLNLYSNLSHNFDGITTIQVGGNFSYIPTNRTRITFGQNLIYLDADISKQIASSTRVSMQYFVSPNLSLNANLQFSYSDRSLTNRKTYNLNHNFGIRYYIF